MQSFVFQFVFHAKSKEPFIERPSVERDRFERYGVTIHRVRAEKPIPVCCKIYGQPFISKQVSEWIERLQNP